MRSRFEILILIGVNILVLFFNCKNEIHYNKHKVNNKKPNFFDEFVNKSILFNDRYNSNVKSFRFFKDNKYIVFYYPFTDNKGFEKYSLRSFNIKTREIKTLFEAPIVNKKIKFNADYSCLGVFTLDNSILVRDKYYSKKYNKDQKRCYEIFSETNIEREIINCSDEIVLSPIVRQNKENNKYFLYYSGNKFVVIKYPNAEIKYKYPNEVIEKSTGDITSGWGRNLNEIILSFYDKNNINWLYFYNYIEKKVKLKIELPKKMISGRHFFWILISPNKEWILLENGLGGFYFINLKKYKIYDLLVNDCIQKNGFEIYMDDWSWDSKMVVFHMGYNVYVFRLKELLELPYRSEYLKIYK